MRKRQGCASASAVVFTLLLVVVGGQSTVAMAQQANSFVTVSPIYQGGGDLDRGGGKVSTRGALVRAGTSFDLGGGTRAGITANYDYLDFSFDKPVAFGAAPPWDKVQRYGAAFPVSFRAGDGWVLGAAPSVDWFRENGATEDALAWGATFSAVRVYADGDRLGLGLGAFSTIEDNSIIPFLIVNWRLGENWRLVNPLASGPTGGAGLELDYQFNSRWSLGLGATVRKYRFRLSESGPVRNGIGEERGVPVFLRGTYEMNPQFAMHAYAGVITGGRLRVEDPSGNLLRQDDVGSTPLFALALIARF